MILLATQILFTFTTLWAKYYLSQAESFNSSLQESWLMVYVVIYMIATFMQLYVFKMTGFDNALANSEYVAASE